MHKAQMVTNKMSCRCCLAEIGDRADLTYLTLRMDYLIPCCSNLFVVVPTHLS